MTEPVAQKPEQATPAFSVISSNLKSPLFKYNLFYAFSKPKMLR